MYLLQGASGSHINLDVANLELLIKPVSGVCPLDGRLVGGVGTIANDDSPPVAGFDGDVTADEDTSIPLNPPVDIDRDGIPDTEHVYGESMRFTVTLAGESDRPVTVGYDTETTPGTATSVASCQQHPGNAAEDYRHRSGTLTFTGRHVQDDHRASVSRRSVRI